MGQRLGQHFLRSHSILERIAKAAVPDPESTLVEIGPGRGALTRHLITRVGRLIAIEIDEELIPRLQGEFGEDPRFTLVASDVLKTDLAQWGPLAIAGNLPYYITSPILEKTLRLGPLLRQAVFLVQREVAERLIAKPGTRDYGYLSVQTQFFAKADYLFTVSPGSFQPPPRVDSAVVRLVPHATLPTDDIDGFLRFAGWCFHQKRKNLRNNLRPFYAPEVVDNLPEAGLRGEQLSLPQFLDLYNRLQTSREAPPITS